MDKQGKITDADEQFMVDFYLRNKGYMYYTARKFTESPYECEDAIQDAMVRLLRNAASLRQLSENQVGTYLYLTIRSVFADRARRSREQPVADEALEYFQAEQEPDPEEGLNAIWDTALLKENLPQREWRLLELKYIAGYSDPEIARELGCGPDSVRTMLRRVRKRAKAILTSKQYA